MIFVAAEITCRRHPNYTGQRQPRTAMGCFTCEIIWQIRRSVQHYAKKYTIQHAPMYNARVMDTDGASRLKDALEHVRFSMLSRIHDDGVDPTHYDHELELASKALGIERAKTK